MSRPRNKTIKSVVEYLESIGLSVYGTCTDLEDGYQYCGCMDYTPEQVVRYRHLVEAGALYTLEEEDD